MDQRTVQILFALLRSAICGTKLTEDERNLCAPERLAELLKMASGHDVAHLLALGLKQNGLLPLGNDMEKPIFQAAYRYEQLKHEYDRLCAELETAQIPFLPLKGSVIRQHYPEPWMRTSCDIDILVHREDLGKTVSHLVQNRRYVEKERSPHDVSLFAQTGIHVEIHYDLVEEGRANNAIEVLQSVWENATLHEGHAYWYEMTDAYFYFYHIAHMAKHFESGGCGVRPFIDLWILDHMDNADTAGRNALLDRGGLRPFADVSRVLSDVWFGGRAPDELSLQMQDFLLRGGVYGSADNRVALGQKKKGGRMGYVLSRIFIPYTQLKRYYPVLEKHRWLMPLMQVRRWFMLLQPDVAKMARREMAVNGNLSKAKAAEMSSFLDEIGLG